MLATLSCNHRKLKNLKRRLDMGNKSYLKNQIRLVSLNANDLFTDQEYDMFMDVCGLVHEIEKMDNDPNTEAVKKKELIAERKRASMLLTQEIKKHNGTPRKVRLKSILSLKKDQVVPNGATWKTLKFTKKISEFESEMSRAMGLHHLDQTFDKIIIKWKNEDVLEQIVKDGFTLDILKDDGTIETKKYQYLTSSAGQFGL
jgi:hypothetical protein